MYLAIMTRGRVGKQTTLSQLPPKWRDRTVLVCPPQEVGLHQHPTLSSPAWVTNYSEKFQWILDGFPEKGPGRVEGAPSKIIILDDDLVFSKKEWVPADPPIDRSMRETIKTIRDPVLLEPMF